MLEDSGALIDQPHEGIDRFRDDLRDLKQRWDNRLILERVVSLSEAYLNGRLEVVLYGDWLVGDHEFQWACRVAANAEILNRVSGDLGVDPSHGNHGHGRNDQVVLVEVAEIVEQPDGLVQSVGRPYLFEKKFFGSGEGFLYRRQGCVVFEVFPFGMHGEVWLEAGRGAGSNDAARKVIQCGSQIVDRVTDDDCERLWDWLFGAVGKLKGAGLRLEGMAATPLNRDLVEAAIQGRGPAPKLIDVCVGPLNL